VLGPEAFVLRFFGAHNDDRLLVVNLGSDLHLPGHAATVLRPYTRQGHER
jgi:maltooligosyltrehalose trehalohydrolase